MEKEEKFKFNCTYPKCKNIQEKKLILICCDRCKNAKYCSQECYSAHIDAHFEECFKDKSIKNPNRTSRIFFSNQMKEKMIQDYDRKKS